MMHQQVYYYCYIRNVGCFTVSDKVFVKISALPLSQTAILFILHYCFEAVGWAAGRASGLCKLSAEVLAWLFVWSEVQMICIWSS